MTNPYAPPRAAVRDIADPRGQAVPADRGTRLAASILDGLIFAAMVYAPVMLIILFAGAGGPEPGAANSGAMLVGAALTVIGFVAWCWLTIGYVTRNGQSIAKKILGIKVVRSDGTPISLGRLFWLRNVVNSLIGVVPLYVLIDSLFIFGESRQCVHDKIADTIVVQA